MRPTTDTTPARQPYNATSYKQYLTNRGEFLLDGDVYTEKEYAHARRHAQDYTVSNAFYNPLRIFGLLNKTSRGEYYDESHPQLQFTDDVIESDKKYTHDAKYDKLKTYVNKSTGTHSNITGTHDTTIPVYDWKRSNK